MAEVETSRDGCPVDFVLKKISGPWTTHILWLLRTHGILRFGELRRLLPDISPKMLTDRLKRLEADGLIARDYQPTIPPTVSYSLTKRGVQLKAMLDALGDVATRWRAEDEKASAQNRGSAKASRQASSAIGAKTPRASSRASSLPSATPK
ncbi:MAG TPA: helix-turn-helix domain-containing protein [Rhodoblastus sp.]|nr:helix-turn-helix domain-containing protein [Rhodoblastus sp.]